MKENFIKLIESIGFKHDETGFYVYKNYTIGIYNIHYDFFTISSCYYNLAYDKRIIFKSYFKKEIRSYKLKQLLNHIIY